MLDPSGWRAQGAPDAILDARRSGARGCLRVHAGRVQSRGPSRRRPGEWLGESHYVEAYADRISAAAGDRVQVMASTSAAIGARWRLFRLGWYGGAGARRMTDPARIALSTQPRCPANATTGLVRCAWTPSFAVQVPQDAVSGLYVVTIVRDDGWGTFVPLVVRDARRADLLFQASVTTYQAYNGWGGESLYEDAAGVRGGKAPYLSGHGAGDLFVSEARLARFLEQYGYDVTYTTNLDVVREGAEGLRRARAFLSVGHDEYWAGAERDLLEAARDEGTSLFFLGANPAYWKIRTSDPGADGNPRTITCYKAAPAGDPLAGTPEATGRFRDVPFSRPEEALVGAMYESWLLFPQAWIVSAATSFLFTGTGLHNGDAIPLLVGYEYDRTFSEATPSPVTVLARSPLVDGEGRPGFAESTLYRVPSGALVFAAGTIYWSLGVETDARVARMTANLLEAAVGAPVPAALEQPAPPAQDPPIGTWASSVTTVASGLVAPTGIAQLGDGSLLVADPRAQQVVRLSGGATSVFAGDGHESDNASYDNCPARRARFFQPTSVAVDARGTVYVADTENSCIRAIFDDPSHTVVTFAGAMARPGFNDGQGRAARFLHPTGVTYDAPRGRLLVADTGNDSIRAVDVATANVTTIAGAGPGEEADGPAATARFNAPTSIAVAADGRIFFVASGTNRGLSGAQIKLIRTDADRTVVSLTTGAFGFADGPGNSARLLPQGGLVWDGSALYVADPGNYRIRRVVPGNDAASTRVFTVAGTGLPGTADGRGDVASFGVPLGMFRTADGTLLVADGLGAIRALKP